jgi:hypothetical protein
MCRSKVNNSFIISGLVLLIALSGCRSDKEAVGPDDKIFVVADSITYNKLKEALQSAFEKTIFTPHAEKSFELVRKDFSDIDEIKNFKNIILVSETNSSSKESNFITSILDNKQKEELTAGKKFVFLKKDLWKKDQLVMILTLPDLELLRQSITANNEFLMMYFHKESSKRILDALLNSDFERKDVEENLYKKYGWKIFIPANFDLALNIPNDKFVWLRSNTGNDFAKWVFIHWIDNASPELLTPDSIIYLRNRLTEKYFRSSDNKSFVTINLAFRKTDEANFNGHYALASQGLWEMSDKSKGGPFINYAFYDEKTRRLYILDGSIYAPKYQKKELIQQLDVMLQSFVAKH